jgi:hypothetical protein
VKLRASAFACVLAVAGALIVVGIEAMHRPSAFIVGGILLALNGYLVLGGDE